MTFTGHFSDDRIRDMFKVAVDLRLASSSTRAALFASVSPSFFSQIPTADDQGSQLKLDLQRLNETKRLKREKTPFEQWLRQAVDLSGGDEQAQIFQKAADELEERRSRTQLWSPPPNLPEFSEPVDHPEEHLPFGFLERGRSVGAGVARVQVPRYEGAQPIRSGATPVSQDGTGWLIGPRLLITSFHVVNARHPSEEDADATDLDKQARSATVEVGFDGPGRQGSTIRVLGLAASDAELDYAILRLERDVAARPLPWTDELPVEAEVHPPVNIIRHPPGGPKTIAIRGNLATRLTDNDLRYFTHRDEGSSGSPVLDDQWRVVAQHRAAAQAPRSVRFQSREGAIVNVATRITRIRAHLEERGDGLWDEIADARSELAEPTSGSIAYLPGLQYPEPLTADDLQRLHRTTEEVDNLFAVILTQDGAGDMNRRAGLAIRLQGQLSAIGRQLDELSGALELDRAHDDYRVRHLERDVRSLRERLRLFSNHLQQLSGSRVTARSAQRADVVRAYRSSGTALVGQLRELQRTLQGRIP